MSDDDDWRGALVAEFAEPEALVEAVSRVRRSGFRQFDAFTPFPLKGLAEAMQLQAGWLAWIGAAGFLFGGTFGYLLQWYLNAVDYPLNVGGRPLAAWPAFTLPAFEIAVLFATLASFLAMLVKNRLPRLHHPLFDVERFGLASKNRFFLVISRSDPLFDADRSRRFLTGLGAQRISEVPP